MRYNVSSVMVNNVMQYNLCYCELMLYNVNVRWVKLDCLIEWGILFIINAKFIIAKMEVMTNGLRVIGGVTLLLLSLFLTCINSQKGVDCIFNEGDRQNCRSYCQQYFVKQPQLSWYNMTSKQCQPLRICALRFHFYDYQQNECFTDATMLNLAPSQIPQTLIQQRIARFYINNVCVNGQAQSEIFNDVKCFCYFMWQNSGKVDMNGYPYKCDQAIGPQKWKGYFFKDTIIDKNGTVLMYGQFTPGQLQVFYQNLKKKQLQQTNQFIYMFQRNLLNLIYTQSPQQGIIREGQYLWVLGILGVFYLVFAFSYLRFQSQIIKVTRKQLAQRVGSILQDRKAFQGQF